MFSFIETRAFTKLVLEYLTDAEYAALQAALIADPEAGPVIPGSGGVRKLRWAAPGRGQTWRLSDHLLRASCGRSDLDVDDVPKERG